MSSASTKIVYIESMLRSARWIACVALLLVVGGSAVARVPRGAWVVLEVGQVSVKASRPGGGDWDDARLDADRCGLRGTMRRQRPLGECRLRPSRVDRNDRLLADHRRRARSDG